MVEEKRALGALPSKIDIRDYKIKKKVAMAQNYPEVFELDHKVEVKNQGQVGSCVAHAAAEILEWNANNSIKLSTDFIYGIHYKLFNSKGPGMFLREACKIVKDYGDPELQYCPSNTEVDEVYGIAEKVFDNKTAMKNANKYRIKSYTHLMSDNDIKYALMNYGPVFISIKWFNGNKYDKETGKLVKGVGFDGFHAIIIVGWNEEGWICQNSWGKYWGKGGYFVLDYDYGIFEAYSFIKGDYDDSEINKPSSNSILNGIYKMINGVINFFVGIFR